MISPREVTPMLLKPFFYVIIHVMPKRAIFIAATGQNVGKTTVCLGAIAGMHTYYKRVGFIKPVGQQHILVDKCLRVDKDVVLFKERFDLPSSYQDMSPVIFPRGFTRDYLDGAIEQQELLNKVKGGFETIYNDHDFTIVEGTGHVGVGSLVELSNAFVAKELGLDVVIIAKGGLGSAFDELAINKAMCDRHGVKLAGVILNRVIDEKREMVIDYMLKALKRWDVPLIGAIPYDDLLGTPCMKDFELLFKANLISGEEYHYCHFKQIRLAASSVEHFLEHTFPDQLIVTPASREDLICALLVMRQQEKPEYGLILTSQQAPSEKLVEKLKRANIPALYTPKPTFDVMQSINTYTAKIRKGDEEKVDKAIDLVSSHLNFNLLMQSAD